MAAIAPGQLTTADGTPLKVSFARALRRSRLKALGLVLPLFAFLLITFLVPIGDMLFRSVENQLVGRVLHRTVAALADWDPASGELPGEPVFEALVADFVEGGRTAPPAGSGCGSTTSWAACRACSARPGGARSASGRPPTARR